MKKLNYLKFTFFLLLPLSLCALDLPYTAICIVPVADVIGEPIQNFELSSDATQAYNCMPASWGPCEKDRRSCPRVHQLLFHEQVLVLQEENDEVCVQLPHCFYLKENQAANIFWMQKKCLLPLTADSAIQSCLPPLISFEQNNIQDANKNVATLISPYFCELLQLTLSAGTRFKIAQEQENHFSVYMFDPAHNAIQLLDLPKSYALKTDGLDEGAQRRLFVNIVRQWAHGSGIIPYIWGGCSFQEKIIDGEIEEKTLQTLSGKILAYWHRTHMCTNPLNGFDCSSLIFRAAQIVSLSLYAKNTTTMAHSFCPVADDEPLQDGDLIWFKGHIIIISSVEHNLIVEARGYSSGFGKLHELPLEKIFYGIRSFDQLRHQLQEKKSLLIINKNGDITKELEEIKLLKLLSCKQIKLMQ